MALSIKDPSIDKAARKLAKLTGEKLTEAIGKSIRQRLEQEERRRKRRRSKYDEIMKIIKKGRKMRVYDTRSADEIMGFNEHGVFD